MDRLRPPYACSARPPARRRRGPLRAALRGAGQTLGVVGAFVALGLGAGLVARGSAGADAAYTPPAVAPSSERPALWLVDGFNVLHAVLLGGEERAGFWREEARLRLLERVAAFDDPQARVVVVFDGPGPSPPAAAGERLEVVFAPSADEWLLRRVREAAPAGGVAVVTADRRLGDRAGHRGARVVSPRAFLARCPEAQEGAGYREDPEAGEV